MPTYYTKNGKKIMYPNAYAKQVLPCIHMVQNII